MAKKRNPDEEFEITYQVDDGYAGGSRPQYTTILADDLEDDMTDDDLEKLWEQYIQEAFEQKISWWSDSLEEFKDWAHERIEAMKDESNG